MNLSTINLIKRKFKCCDSLLSAEVTITQAQMMTIGTNPIILINTVPSNKIIIPVKTIFKSTGSNYYDTSLRYVDQANQDLWGLNIYANSILVGEENLGIRSHSFHIEMKDIYEYQFMQLKIKGDVNPTNGNGDVYIKFFYKLIDNTEAAFFNA